jgi:hypothetical protein
MPKRNPDHALTYARVTNDEEALQIAIEKWIRYQYHIWEESSQPSLKLLDFFNTFFRISMILLSASITTMSDIELVPRTTITIIGGILTVLAGVEGFFKLTDRRVLAENRKRELLAERDKWGYQWMVDVELEKDTSKALVAAKKLLLVAPQATNDLMNKYVQRSSGEPTTKPK